jgi:hypothetical protein
MGIVAGGGPVRREKWLVAAETLAGMTLFRQHSLDRPTADWGNARGWQRQRQRLLSCRLGRVPYSSRASHHVEQPSPPKHPPKGLERHLTTWPSQGDRIQQARWSNSEQLPEAAASPSLYPTYRAGSPEPRIPNPRLPSPLIASLRIDSAWPIASISLPDGLHSHPLTIAKALYTRVH